MSLWHTHPLGFLEQPRRCYLVVISCWEEWPSAECVRQEAEGCAVATTPSPNFRNPESQGKLLKVNQQRLVSSSDGKGKLENQSYSTETHGKLYQNISLSSTCTISQKILKFFWLWKHASGWQCCDIKFNPWASGLLGKFFKWAHDKKRLGKISLPLQTVMPFPVYPWEQ